MHLKTGTTLSLMLALAIFCNQIPDSGWLHHVAQLLIVGCVYISRDVLQTLMGDYLVLVPMGVLVLVIWVSSEHPYASASGFLIGLLFGWAVFTQWYSRSLANRLLASGLVACVVDSAIYLSAIGRMDQLVHDTAIKVVPVVLLYIGMRIFACRTSKVQ